MHRGCRCVQRAIWPGKTSQPFTDFRAKIDALAPDQRAKVVGVANLQLIEQGVVKWEDVVTGQRVRDLREVVASKKLSVATMTGAGVTKGIAERAYATVNTPANELADQQRRELLQKVLAKGVTKEQLKQALGQRLAARVGIAGPGGPESMPVTPTPVGPAPKAKAKPKPAAKAKPVSVPLPVEARVDYLVKAKVKPEVAVAAAKAEAEAAAKLKAEEMEAARLAAEEAARVKAEAEAVAKKKVAEAAAKKKQAEEKAAKKAREEADLLAARIAQEKAWQAAKDAAEAAKAAAWKPRKQSEFREFTNTKDMEAWGKESFGDWADGLTQPEKNAIKLYAADNFKWMNAIERGETPKASDLPYGLSMQGAREYIDRTIAPLARARVDRDVVAFRGVKDVETMGIDRLKLKVGDELDVKGFGSFSMRKETAAAFALQTGRTPRAAILQVNTPAGSTGAYLNAGELSGYDHERELLMPPGGTLRFVREGGTHKDVWGNETPILVFERVK